MKKKHTPVGKVLLAAAKVKEPASVGEKIASEFTGLPWIRARVIVKDDAQAKLARRIDAAVRKAAWESYDLGCNVKELVAQGRFPCSEMERKYGPRPRSKR